MENRLVLRERRFPFFESACTAIFVQLFINGDIAKRIALL
jgi:hypothetical protein